MMSWRSHAFLLYANWLNYCVYQRTPFDVQAIELVIRNALDASRFDNPDQFVGQAYDGGLEGGPPGTPTYDELSSFIATADADGAAGVSFWSWQHASDEMWAAIANGPEVGARRQGG